jgi:N-acetylglutamate synthase-like GNAT family acetyltransferase
MLFAQLKVHASRNCGANIRDSGTGDFAYSARIKIPRIENRRVNAPLAHFGHQRFETTGGSHSLIIFATTNTPMEIRLLATGTSDYEQMKRLRLEVLLRPIGVPETYINPARERNELLVGAFEGEEMIGCCVLTPVNETQLQLRQMAVATEQQGKKVGARIVTFAEEVAREKGFSELFMNARDAVLDFYTKCGYTIRGEQFFEVGIPHHLMYKAL